MLHMVSSNRTGRVVGVVYILHRRAILLPPLCYLLQVAFKCIRLWLASIAFWFRKMGDSESSYRPCDFGTFELVLLKACDYSG